MRVLPIIKNLRRVNDHWAADLQVGTATVPVDARFGAWFAHEGAKDLDADVCAMLAAAVRKAERAQKRAAA